MYGCICIYVLQVEPNPYKKGIFDLPVLSQTVCGQFLSSHEKDLEQFKIGKDVLNQHFTQEQMERLFRDSPDDDEKSLSLVSLLKYGVEKTSYAGSCYAAAVDFMMYHQDAVPFLIAADEFNCFYKATGHYFHMDYDENVHKSIPYDQISLFKPAMDAMALSASDTTEEDAVPPAEPKAMKHSLGGVVVAFTESHAVPRAVTDALTAFAVQDKSLTHCAVPRLSAIEVEHMLANYEATGVGKLRLDRGETVMNDQEVAYLRMVSGGVAQHLMNASMI